MSTQTAVSPKGKLIVTLSMGAAFLLSGISMSVSAATTSCTYDSLNRLAKTDYGNGLVINYTYDAAGNRITQVMAAVPLVVISPMVKTISPVAQSYAVTVSSNTSWSVSENSSWVSVSPINGSGNGSVTVTVDANTSSSSRSGTVSFGGQSHRLVQEGASSSGPEIEIRRSDGKSFTDGKSTRDFGSLIVGNAGASKVFIIKNKGTAKLKGLKITKSGMNKSDFSVSKLSESSLAPGSRETFKVKFRPSAKGSRSAVIHVASNDANENPFEIKLVGKGVAKAAASPAIPKSLFGVGNSAFANHFNVSKDSIVSTGVIDGKKYLTITLSKNVASPAASFRTEVSPNLLDWYSGWNYTTVLRDNDVIFEARDNTPMIPGKKRYIRVVTGLPK